MNKNVRHNTILLFAFWAAILFFSGKINAAPQRIYLLRHAEVAIEKPGWGKAEKVREYKKQYNRAPVKKEISEELQLVADSLAAISKIYCSKLLRSQQTAGLLFGDSVNCETDQRLNEIEYPVLNNKLIKFPVKFWLSLSRGLWMLNLNKKGTNSVKEEKERIGKLAVELAAISEKEGNVFIVGHGFFNRLMLKELKKNGWKVERFEGYKNLSLNCLIKSKKEIQI